MITFAALLMDPEANILDDEQTLLSCIEADYVQAFAPHLIDMLWQFMDTNSWIIPLEQLLPDQINALKAVGAKEVEAEKRVFIIRDKAELYVYQCVRDQHRFCVASAIEEDYSIEVYIVGHVQPREDGS